MIDQPTRLCNSSGIVAERCGSITRRIWSIMLWVGCHFWCKFGLVCSTSNCGFIGVWTCFGKCMRIQLNSTLKSEYQIDCFVSIFRFHYHQMTNFKTIKLHSKYQSCKSNTHPYDGWITLMHWCHPMCWFGRTKWLWLKHRHTLIVWLMFWKIHQKGRLPTILHGGKLIGRIQIGTIFLCDSKIDNFFFRALLESAEFLNGVVREQTKHFSIIANDGIRAEPNRSQTCITVLMKLWVQQ